MYLYYPLFQLLFPEFLFRLLSHQPLELLPKDQPTWNPPALPLFQVLVLLLSLSHQTIITTQKYPYFSCSKFSATLSGATSQAGESSATAALAGTSGNHAESIIRSVFPGKCTLIYSYQITIFSRN
jgi:hypothetical protein